MAGILRLVVFAEILGAGRTYPKIRLNVSLYVILSIFADTQAVLNILGVVILDDMGRISHTHITFTSVSYEGHDMLTTTPAVVGLILFWPMIQMGVALVAACLPTLRPLFHGVSPESVIQSIRSNFSLSSLRSKASFHHIKSSSPRTSKDDTLPIAFPNESYRIEQLETHISASTGPSHGLDQHSLHEIKVQNDFSQSVECS